MSVKKNVRGDFGKIMERGDGKPLDPNYDGTRQYSWNEIRNLTINQDGVKYSRQAFMLQWRKSIVKLRKRLLEDPHIKDWLIDSGLDDEIDREPEDISIYEKPFKEARRA
jgi:hypothetical protein